MCANEKLHLHKTTDKKAEYSVDTFQESVHYKDAKCAENMDEVYKLHIYSY